MGNVLSEGQGRALTCFPQPKFSRQDCLGYFAHPHAIHRQQLHPNVEIADLQDLGAGLHHLFVSGRHPLHPSRNRGDEVDTPSFGTVGTTSLEWDAQSGQCPA